MLCEGESNLWKGEERKEGMSGKKGLGKKGGPVQGGWVRGPTW